MRIAIYDTRHFEMVNVLLRVFDKPGNELIFFVSPVIHQKLLAAYGEKMESFRFVVEVEKENSFFFFRKVKEVESVFKPDLFIFNTIDKDYKDVWNYLKGSDFRYIVTIHNINTWLSPPFTLNRIALKNYYFRKKILRKSSALIVQEELFVKNIRERKLYRKPIFTVPHTLKQDRSDKVRNEKITIAIPGAIDGVRRDIDFTLDVIEEVSAKSNRFQFVFVGIVIGYLGEAIHERMVELQRKGLDILHVYNEKSNEDFDFHMKRCDVVLVPLNVNTKFEGIPEIYGSTKVTGVIYDMMRFSKPGIVPVKMAVPPTMKKSVLAYRDKSQLVELILSFQNNPGFLDDWKKKAEEESEYYTEQAISKRLIPALDSFIVKASSVS